MLDGLDHVPPHDLPAEQSALGAMLMTGRVIDDVLGHIRTAADFYRPAHGEIYTAIVDLYRRGEPADAISVAAELGRRDVLDRIGGPGYLRELIATVPTAANAGYYARRVAELAVKRRIGEAGMKITQAGFNPASTATETIDVAEAALLAALTVDQGDDPKAPADTLPATLDMLETMSDRAGGPTGLPTGFADLDAALHGLHPGQLVVVAGRPGLGKSTLGLDFARTCAVRDGSAALLFSLEMNRDEINMRLLSAEARVSLQSMRAGRLTAADWERMAGHLERIAAAPLYVDTSPSLTVMAIRSKARRLARRHELSLIVVDYLQLLTHGGRRNDNRQQEVAEMSRSLKMLAGELGVPVVALSQLNRGAEQRNDKRPQLGDLRESGAIEQDADVVILVHRDDAYNRESARAGEADLIIAKQRSGPLGTVTVAFQGHYSRFVDMAN